jgi:hypothetical protein
MAARLAGFSIALALFLAPIARADDQTHYEIGAYIWGTSLASQIDSSDGETSVHVPFSELVKHISGGLQLHGRAEWDRWSLNADGSYARLTGDSETKVVRFGPQGGGLITGDVKAQLDEWIVELNGGYRLFQVGSLFSNRPTDERKFRGEAYLGVRYWSVDPRVEVTTTVFSNVTKFHVGDRQMWIDPVIGLRFAADLSSTVQLRVAGDVGGFNIGNYCSDFTWEQMTTLSWRFGESWSTHVGYKFLDFHRSAGDSSQRMQVRGPFIALSYAF